MQQTVLRERIDIHRVLTDGVVATHLQPIASMRRQELIGVEALARCQLDGEAISPVALFAAAERAGLAPELDRLCRRRALESFRELHARQPELVLFVNCHVDTLADSPFGPDGWASLAREFGINPPNIAVEISEEDLGDVKLAREAAHVLRELGFLMVLDDVGVRSANLDRIAELQPDIIKADRVLVRGVDGDYHRREVLRSLVVLSERLGGWLIAEGVETAEEAVTVVEAGGDMIQGFLLGRPQQTAAGEGVQWDQDMALEVGHRYRAQRVTAGREARSRKEERSAILLSIAEGMRDVEMGLEAALARLIAPYPSIHSAAVLDRDGVQVSDTVLNPVPMLRQKTIIYAPPPRGTDHSLKEYYYLLVAGEADPFETTPYTPLPTGMLAVTLSTRCPGNLGHIVTLHVSADRWEPVT